MAYTVHQAKTHFSRLLREAEAGKEVIVMRGNKPVAKLVPFAEPEVAMNFQRIGGFEGLIPFDEGVFAPLTDQEMIEYGFDNPEKDARFAAACGGVVSESCGASAEATPIKRAE